MFFGKRKCKHDWNTVAIDTSHGWLFVNNPTEKSNHILLYQVCKNCGKRQMEYDDPTEKGRTYAIGGNDTVAKSRSLWIHSGEIRVPKKSENITFIDPAYAPLGDFEHWLRSIRADPALADMLQEKMVDDALGQLEVAVKLHVNNKPKKVGL